MLDVASSPLPEDENTASLQSACHSHLNYTRLRLGIYKPIGAQLSSESSSDDETSENESDEETENASNEVNNQGNGDLRLACREHGQVVLVGGTVDRDGDGTTAGACGHRPAP